MVFSCDNPETFIVRPAGKSFYDERGRVVQKGQRGLSVRFQRPLTAVPVIGSLMAAGAAGEAVRPVATPCTLDTREDQKVRGLTDEEREAIEEFLLTSAAGVVAITKKRRHKEAAGA